jgi:hypothetical protein
LIDAGNGDKKKVTDLAVVASTLWPAVGDYYRKFDALLAEVVSVMARMQSGQRTSGRTKLREKIGGWGMFALAGALRRDGCDYKEALKNLVGFGRVDKGTGDWLMGLYNWLKENEAESPWDPEAQAAQHKQWNGRFTRFMNAIKRPTGCGKCEQLMQGAAGRNLGPTGPTGEASELVRSMACIAKTCTYCFMLKAVSEMELLEELWADRPKGEEGIYVVETHGIESLEHVAVIKNIVSRQPDAKLAITGFGDDGKATLSYFVTNDEAAVIVRSAIVNGGYEACGKRIPSEYRKCSSTRDAIDTAVEAKLSYNMHVKRLIEERRNEELTEWLWWAAFKTSVRNSRNKLALPWPTDKQVQEQIKLKKGEAYEPELYPGEVVTYIIRDVATKFVLARRRKIPFTFDEAMDARAGSWSFRAAQAAASGGAATAVA